MNQMLKACVSSKGTTTLSAVMFFGFVALLGEFGVALLDNDPATVPQWDTLYESGFVLACAIHAFLTRDAFRSSEDVGVK